MSAIEATLRRDRHITIALLVFVCIVGWLYTLFGVGMSMTAFEMTDWPWSSVSMPSGTMEMSNTMEMSTMMAMEPQPWSLGYSLLLLGMWWFMMVAMMLPSATPTVLLAAAINRRSTAETPPFGPVASFVTGYLGIWLIFSTIAVFAQMGLTRSGQLSGMMTVTSYWLSALLLIAAGIWQWTPLKQACLRYCRSPLDFLLKARGKGVAGAFRTGLEHGAYCLGCCWFLMALLFVGGIMNVFWIVGLAIVVLVEKVARFGVGFGKMVGVILVIAGLLMLAKELPQNCC